MNVPDVMAVRCHYCSRERRFFEVHQISGGSQIICESCLDWHNRAIEFLTGGAIPGCQACGATWELLRDREPGHEVRLYVVPKDGIYQVLCKGCIAPYVSKRTDLYRGTKFGAARGM